MAKLEKGSENAAARAEGPWTPREDGRASCVAERGDMTGDGARLTFERERARSGSKGSGGWFQEAERRTRDGSSKEAARVWLALRVVIA